MQMIEQNAASAGMNREQIARQMLRKVFAPKTKMEDIAAFDKEIASPVRLTASQHEAVTKSLQSFMSFLMPGI